MVGSGPPAPDTQGVWVERVAQLMGTRLHVRLHAPDRRHGLEAIEGAFDAVAQWESLLSTWRMDSELSRLNRSPIGESVRPSPALAGLLAEIDSWTAATDGAFDPRVGVLVDAWDLRGAGRIPSSQALRKALASAGPAALEIDRDGTVTRNVDGARMDAGAFGKGTALRAARESLEVAGVRHARLDFGGQIVVVRGSLPRGSLEDRSGSVSVAHPEHRQTPVKRLSLTAGSVATSGASERHMTVDGRVLTHIVDPRTGSPVRPWGSVTVVAEDPLVADILSTALYVMGPEEGRRWAMDRADVGVLLLTLGPGGEVREWANGGISPWLVEPGPASRPSSAQPTMAVAVEGR